VITDSWVMAAMIRSAPRRHKGQVAIARSNTRPSSLAQLQRGVPVLASCLSTPCWRGVGVIAPRRLLCGAKQPPDRTRWTRGSAAHAHGSTPGKACEPRQNRVLFSTTCGLKWRPLPWLATRRTTGIFLVDLPPQLPVEMCRICKGDIDDHGE